MSIYDLNTVYIAESYMCDRVGSATLHYAGSKALVNIAAKRPPRILTKAHEALRKDIINFRDLVGQGSEFNITNFISYAKPRDMDSFYMALTLLIMKYPEKSDEQIDYENKVRRAKEKIMSMTLSR